MSQPVLALDHVILRSPEPQATVDELSVRLGAPVLAAVEELAGMASGIVRAGALDIEVLRIGDAAPAGVQGYGLGFTADAPLGEVAGALRAAGYPTSPPVRATASGRTWRAFQVHGLLPDPFPLPTSTRPPGFVDRLGESLGSVATRVPALARRATRNSGSSMVVITEYGFDADAWRARAGRGPDVVAVDVGTGDRDWASFPLAPGRVRLDRSGPPGVRRIVLEGTGDAFALGAVEFAFRAGC